MRMLGGVMNHVTGAERDGSKAIARRLIGTPTVRWLALLGLCAAYLQGSLTKLFDFPSAIAEMTHFGLSPPTIFAAVTIAFELVASAMVLSGIGRWIGALALAGFTLLATFIALRFWEIAPPARTIAANAFFEHVGLVGGFLLVAWHDLKDRSEAS